MGRRQRWVFAVVVALVVGVIVLFSVIQGAPGAGPAGGPPMTGDEIVGAAAALHTAHPTAAERTDLAMARNLGMSDADIRSADETVEPTRGNQEDHHGLEN
jgi:hypothetical protein